MIFRTLLLIFIISSSLVLVTSCGNNKDFQLPQNVELTDGNIINPLYINNILGNPNRTEFIWSDSLLKKCEITKITISNVDGEDTKKVFKEFIYSIDKHGNLNQYLFFDYDQSKSAYSKSTVFSSKNHEVDSIEVHKFLGIDSKNKLIIERSENSTTYQYEKGLGKYDQVIYYYTKDKSLEMIVRKIGDVMTSIDFIVQENTPMSTLKKMIHKVSKDNTEIELAQKNVIYIKKNKPTSAYSINVDWAQQDLIQEWEYDGLGNLLIYKEYVNKSIIKEIQLTYSSDNLLRSFIFNKELYSIKYN